MRSASSSRAPSRAATALTASLSMFRTSVPRIDASTFSSLTVVPNVGLARRASAAVCERGGVAFREAEPRSGGSDRVDRIAPRGGRWHPGRRVACASCGVAWRGDASARRLSRRPPGPSSPSSRRARSSDAARARSSRTDRCRARRSARGAGPGPRRGPCRSGCGSGSPSRTCRARSQRPADFAQRDSFGVVLRRTVRFSVLRISAIFRPMASVMVFCCSSVAVGGA